MFDTQPTEVPCFLDLTQLCLVLVVQHLVLEPRSLFSAARACSRLHSAAAQVFSHLSIKLHRNEDSIAPVPSEELYLFNHSKHLTSLHLQASSPDSRKVASPDSREVVVYQLPSKLQQLQSFRCESLTLKLQQYERTAGAYTGVLQGGSALSKLDLSRCWMVGGAAALEDALPGLPSLQDLTLSSVWDARLKSAVQRPGLSTGIKLSASFLQELSQRQLTRLHLWNVSFADNAAASQLQQLKALQDMELGFLVLHNPDLAVTALNLPVPHSLTLLKVCGAYTLIRARVFAAGVAPVQLDMSALAQQTQLQLLDWSHPQVLQQSVLQPLQQLTHLKVIYLDEHASAADCAALTSSSNLQRLEVGGMGFDQTVWQHLFPADRKLPHLRELHAAKLGSGWRTLPTAAQTAQLDSTCPALQVLDLGESGSQEQWSKADFEIFSAQLSPLSQLTGLQDLRMPCVGTTAVSFLQSVSTLRSLDVGKLAAANLVLTTQLTQLTRLVGQLQAQDASDVPDAFEFSASKDSTVWGQVLEYCNRRERQHDKAVQTDDGLLGLS